MRSDSISKYKGVSWVEATGKWLARIVVYKTRYELGCFTCKHAAARAYNDKARELRGEFAYLNVVNEEQQ